MTPIEIIIVALMTALLGVMTALLRKPAPTPEVETTEQRPDIDALGRVEALERRWELLQEDIDERIERGNKAWRRVRSAQRVEEQRLELEGEEPPGPELHLFDEPGGEPERVPSMYGDMGDAGQSPAPHQQVAREIAQRIAGGGF